MTDSPLVSIIIPAYNAAKWIAETLESVLAQDYKYLEVIVVNDGSEDDTAAVVASFGERVQCISKPNGGQGSARNTGIKASKGEYIAFLDADDMWAKEKLQLQIDLLVRTGICWVYSDAIAFNATNGKYLFRFGKKFRQYEGDILKPLFLSCFLPSATPVIHRSVFETVGYFNESKYFINREDLDMWLRIAAKYPVGLISKPLAYYRVHATSMTGGEDPAAALKGTLAVIEKAVERDPQRLKPFKNLSLANCYISVGRNFASMGRLSEARQMFRNAIQLSPGFIKGYIYWVGCLIGNWPLRVAIKTRRWMLSK